MPGVLGGLVGSFAAISSDYELISTTIISGSSTNQVLFNSIPTSYRHLELRMSVRSTVAANNDATLLQFNGDTGSNYWWHRLETSGNTTAISTQSNQSGQTTSIRLAATPGNNNDAGFGACVLQIVDYRSSSKHKTTKAITGYASASTSTQRELSSISGLWRAATPAAITSLRVFMFGSNNFAPNSRISLYGIKG